MLKELATHHQSQSHHSHCHFSMSPFSLLIINPNLIVLIIIKNLIIVFHSDFILKMSKYLKVKKECKAF